MITLTIIAITLVVMLLKLLGLVMWPWYLIIVLPFLLFCLMVALVIFTGALYIAIDDKIFVEYWESMKGLFWLVNKNKH